MVIADHLVSFVHKCFNSTYSVKMCICDNIVLTSRNVISLPPHKGRVMAGLVLAASS